MYSGGSVVVKFQQLIKKSCPPLLNFHSGSKYRIMASFSTSLNFDPPAFENAARYPIAKINLFCSNDRPISPPSLVKLGPRTPKNRSVKCPTVPPSEIARQKRAKSLITQPWIIRFRSNFVQSLNAWHPKFNVNRSKVKVTAWGNVCKNSQNYLIQPGIARFCSNFMETLFDHTTLDVSRTSKVIGSEFKVT